MAMKKWSLACRVSLLGKVKRGTPPPPRLTPWLFGPLRFYWEKYLPLTATEPSGKKILGD